MIFNTKLEEVKGVVVYNDNSTEEKITLRFTSHNGETLSLQYNNIMLVVKFEDVMKLVEKTREEDTL